VVEKPLGHDGASSRAINAELAEIFDESQIYRIDHYLGKETVQNLMALRFANVIFETQWNNNHIDHVQITVAETVGVGDRAGYYNSYGAIRDMVQNHLLQLVCLVAMEPPSFFDADQVRDESCACCAPCGLLMQPTSFAGSIRNMLASWVRIRIPKPMSR
jgi:glucose-6-phosphate 1-dehydrogenase